MKYDHSAFDARAAYGRDADSRIRQFMPLVRKLASEHGVDLADVEGNEACICSSGA